MGRTRQTSFKNSEIISASEIGQYHYCSISWYLRKCGHEPISALLDAGAEKHAQLDDVLNKTEKGMKRVVFLATIGFLLLMLAFLVIIFGVVL